MQIQSVHRDSHVEVTRNDTADPYSAYTFAAKIVTSAGVYAGCNDSVHFSDVPRILDNLSKFVRDRRGEVFLDMTEDCRLVFFRWNQKGDVGLRFRVTKYIYGGDPLRTCPVSLSGEFPLDTEYLNALHAEIRALLSSER